MKEEGFSAQTGEQGTQATMAAEGFAGLSSEDSSSGDSSLAGNSLQRHVLSAADAVLHGDVQGGAIEGIVVLSLPELLSLASGGAGAQAAGGAGVQAGGVRFVRVGDDLIIEAGAKTVVVEGYFAASPPPTLTLGSGGQLSPSLVASFLEQGGDFPQKYALGWLQEKFGMADDNGGMQVIGEIISTEGQVRVVRDGLVIRLEAGDMVLEGDIISTGEGAEVFMRFTDKMEFRLGEDARLAIDQYLYDDVSSGGLQVLSIIAGAFSYASGLIAGASPTSVKLQTPHGVIGIRGTKILGEVGDGELVVTVLEGRVALLQEGREVAVLDEPFETLRVDSAAGVAAGATNGGANGDASGVSGIRTEIFSVAEVLQTYDFLDGSEQQLRALGAGERLEDEPIENAGGENAGGNSGNDAGGDNGEVAEVALLSGGDETYILAPVAREEARSFIDAEAGGGLATADLVENLDAVEVEEEIVEEEIVVDPEPPAGTVTYVFDAHGGTDSVTGSGGKIVFVGEEYASATYTFTRPDSSSAAVTLMVGYSPIESTILHIVEFTSDPSSVYDFYTRSGDTDTPILASSLGVVPARVVVEGDGSESDPFLATAAADTITGSVDNDWVSYAGSTARVIVGLRAGTDAAAAVDGWADGDTLKSINNLIGSNHGDFFYGNRNPNTLRGGDGNDDLFGGAGDDILEGGLGLDRYLFQAYDGTDTLTDNGGKIVFSGYDYAGATYTFTRPDVSGEAVTLTVKDSGGWRLNTIKFASDPSLGYSFYGTNNNAIPASSLVVPPLQDGSETNPFLATVDADTFTGSGDNDWVSYERSSGVYVDLGTPAGNKGWAAGDTLNNINNLIGSAFADKLVGDGEANTLRGGAGNDRLEGGAGDDTLRGGAGYDILYGGAGADTLDGKGEGTDRVVYDDSLGVRVSLLLQGQAQQDFEANTFGFVANNNEAVGDILSGIEDITGSDHNDWLTGDGGDNRLHGSHGDDRIEGGAGADTLFGGAGNDRLYGSAGADQLYGGTGGDNIYGGDGDDILEGGVGADTLDGGAGASDYARYDSSGKGVRVDLSLATAQKDFEVNTFGFVANSNEAVGDILSNIERIYASDHNDWLTGDGGDNELRGNRGNDRLEGGAGADTYLFHANHGTDTVTDNGGKIVFEGGYAYAGATYTFTRPDVSGEAVTLTVRNSADNIINVIEFTTYPSSGYNFYTRGYGGTNNNAIPASSLVVPPLQDGSESNPFLATAYPDSFSGTGNDGWVSYEGATSEIMRFLDSTNNNLGWADGDTLSYIENIIGSSNYNNYLYGDSDANTFRGGDGNDYLYGGRGADTLDGGAGADRLEGGAGVDTLDGGTGTDIYVIHVGDGLDTIHDVAGETMTLRFNYVSYVAADFSDTNNFNRDGNNLEITIDKRPDDSITDKITILNAYDTDTTTGTGNSAFTINIEFGHGISHTEVTNEFWHNLA